MATNLKLLVVIAILIYQVSCQGEVLALDILSNFFEAILSVGTSPTDTFPDGSFAGGTFLYITGAGFSSDQHSGSNKVFLDEFECPVIDYWSNAQQIVCETPPIPKANQTQYSISVLVDGLRWAKTNRKFSYASCMYPIYEA